MEKELKVAPHVVSSYPPQLSGGDTREGVKEGNCKTGRLLRTEGRDATAKRVRRCKSKGKRKTFDLIQVTSLGKEDTNSGKGRNKNSNTIIMKNKIKQIFLYQVFLLLLAFLFKKKKKK